MGRRLLFTVAIILMVAPVSQAYNFWGLLFNNTYSSNPPTPPKDGSITQPGLTAAAHQEATASDTGGTSSVHQGAGVIGWQNDNADSQEQGSIGGLGQVAYQTGDSSAEGTQWGYLGMSQTSPDGTAYQSQFVGGRQSASVTGDDGSDGSSCQLMVYGIYQVQQ